MMTKRTQTILVVEDNDELRELLAEHLLAAGYVVRAAKDTETALRLFEHASEVDLLISDFRLAEKKNGVELAYDLQAMRPDLPVLIVTGYPDEASHAAAGHFTIISKPVPRASLLAAVARALPPDSVNGSHSS